MRHHLRAHVDLNSGHGGQKLADLGGAGGVAGRKPVNVGCRIGLKHPLAFELLEVANCQLEDVGLFELGDGLTLGLDGVDHEVAEVIEATVDTVSPLLFDERLHDFAVLVALGH